MLERDGHELVDEACCSCEQLPGKALSKGNSRPARGELLFVLGRM